jgi:hypothetical protein
MSKIGRASDTVEADDPIVVDLIPRPSSTLSIPIVVSSDRPDLITSQPGRLPKAFFDAPYLPFDLYSAPPLSALVNALRKLLTPVSAHKALKRVNATFVDLIAPGKAHLSAPILRDTPIALKAAAKALFLEIRAFLAGGGEAPLSEILAAVGANPAAFAFEAAVQLLTECNSAVVTPENREALQRGWDLMLMLADYCAFPEEQRCLLLSFFLGAHLPTVDPVIAHKATLCILRLASPPPADREEAGDALPACLLRRTSPTCLFGVSAAEVLYKESLAGIAPARDCCTPALVKTLCRKLCEAGATRLEGVFRLSGSRLQEDELFESINKGNWNPACAVLNTVSSLTKRWFRELREPLIPLELIQELTENAAACDCVAAALELAAPQRDTLMYFIGFLQYLLQFEPVTKMNASNLVICLGPMFARLPPPVSLEDMSLSKALSRIIRCLIDELDTSDVFPPDFRG